MASPPTADDYYEFVVTAAEASSHFPLSPLSPAVYFEDLDLVFNHLEEGRAADNLLKAAETEYHPPRALSPTGYYESVPSWKPMDFGSVDKHVSRPVVVKKILPWTYLLTVFLYHA